MKSIILLLHTTDLPHNSDCQKSSTTNWSSLLRGINVRLQSPSKPKHFVASQIWKMNGRSYSVASANSSIRLCSGENARYSEGAPIIPSDSILYGNTLASQIARVIFFGKDFRAASTNGMVVLPAQKVAPLCPCSSLMEHRRTRASRRSGYWDLGQFGHSASRCCPATPLGT